MNSLEVFPPVTGTAQMGDHVLEKIGPDPTPRGGKTSYQTAA